MDLYSLRDFKWLVFSLFSSTTLVRSNRKFTHPNHPFLSHSCSGIDMALTPWEPGFSTKLGDPSTNFSLFGERQAVKNRAFFVWLWEVAPVLMAPWFRESSFNTRWVWHSRSSSCCSARGQSLQSWRLCFQIRLFWFTLNTSSNPKAIEAWLSLALNPLSFTLYATAGLLSIIWHAFPWDGTRYVMSEVLASVLWTVSVLTCIGS